MFFFFFVVALKNKKLNLLTNPSSSSSATLFLLQADPKAAFLSWAAHFSRPIMLLPSSTNTEEEEAPLLPAGPRDCSRRWASSGDRASFDAWTASVLPRARAAIERAFERNEERSLQADGGSSSLELPRLALLRRAELPLLEINGIADLPLSTLRAGLLPAHLNAEAAKDDEGFGADAIAEKLAEWLRFPYAAEALLDSAASAADAAAASSSSSEDLLSIPLPWLSSKKHHHRRRPLPASVDWSAQNVLGPVKNQHINGTPCGCCWAFATTGVVEAVVGVVSQKSPPSLSEQQIIDCDRGPPFDDLGCEGGSVEGEWRRREGERGREF